jgi:hypothetical protein
MTKITQDNILNTVYRNHRILIDKLTEYDMDGNVAVTKKMVTVIRYDNYSDGTEIVTPMIFNVSPYTSLLDMHTMVRMWIDCGCPSDGDANGIPRKWTKEDLQAWASV